MINVNNSRETDDWTGRDGWSVKKNCVHIFAIDGHAGDKVAN
jgi:hypothetical protein